jgi:hypothetical protein
MATIYSNIQVTDGTSYHKIIPLITPAQINGLLIGGKFDSQFIPDAYRSGLKPAGSFGSVGSGDGGELGIELAALIVKASTSPIVLTSVTTEPANPNIGDIYYNAAADMLLSWDGSNWGNSAAPTYGQVYTFNSDFYFWTGIVTGTLKRPADVTAIFLTSVTTEPANPETGDVYYDGITSYTLLSWDGSNWGNSAAPTVGALYLCNGFYYVWQSPASMLRLNLDDIYESLADLSGCWLYYNNATPATIPATFTLSGKTYTLTLKGEPDSGHVEKGDWFVINEITELTGSSYVVDYYIMNNQHTEATTTVPGIVKLSDGTGVGNSVITDAILAAKGYLDEELDPVFTAHTAYDIGSGTGFLKNNGSGVWSYDASVYALASHGHDIGRDISNIPAITHTKISWITDDSPELSYSLIGDIASADLYIKKVDGAIHSIHKILSSLNTTYVASDDLVTYVDTFTLGGTAYSIPTPKAIGSHLYGAAGIPNMPAGVLRSTLPLASTFAKGTVVFEAVSATA